MNNNDLFSAVYNLLDLFAKSDVFYLTYNEILNSARSKNIAPKYSIPFLLSEKVITEVNDHYYLNFGNQLVSSVKKTRDIYSLSELPDNSRNTIYDVKNILKSEAKCHLKNITLVGSYAQNAASPKSDYDFLIVTSRRIKKTININKVDLIQYTPSTFKRSLNQKDEFILWALKYGLTIYDNEFIDDFYPTENISFDELKQRKQDLLERLIYRTQLSFGSDRINVIRKRVLALYEQILRSAIISYDVIPKSSKEIDGQFNRILSEHNVLSGLHLDKTEGMRTKEDLKDFFICIKSFYNNQLRERV